VLAILSKRVALPARGASKLDRLSYCAMMHYSQRGRRVAVQGSLRYANGNSKSSSRFNAETSANLGRFIPLL